VSEEGGIKIITENRKARHNYSIEEKFETGIVLTGTEVKALREGKANLSDSYAIFKNNELYLLQANISPYSSGNRENHEPLRTRKLLMHREELSKLWGRAEMQGNNLIPLKLYFKKGRVKVELALAKSKKAFDKRASIKEKENKRAMDRLKKRR
jgi:SsrA-binding protein